jgi:hypothetical protein
MTRILSHVRTNLIAYLALFVALGGTSYAAFSLPPGSVGGPQIQNHVIDPVKFDPKAINGSVRVWAYYAPALRYTAGPGRPVVRGGTPGLYLVSWRKIARPTTACAVLATVDGSPGYATATQVRREIGVSTYDPQGQLTPLAFEIVVIC